MPPRCRSRWVHAGQAWKKILVLCEFHLRACRRRLRTLGEYVEYEARAVEYLHFQLLLDVAHLLGGLGRRQRSQVRFRCLPHRRVFPQASRPDVSARIRVVEFLQEPFFRFGPCGACQECELVEIFVGLCLVLLLSYESDEHVRSLDSSVIMLSSIIVNVFLLQI